jgi:hypothetical protein
MSFRRTASAVAIGACATACATIAGIDATYQSVPADASHGDEDATTTIDAGAAPDDAADEVQLTEAAAADAAPPCIAATCASLGANCGSSIPDGCGNFITCGACEGGATCGGAGANHCGPGSCEASVCTPSQCGVVSDGCGGQHPCPDQCMAPMQCGGGACGGCSQDGARCTSGKRSWPAWKCFDTGPSRGGGCNRIQYAFPPGTAYYCCPQPP